MPQTTALCLDGLTDIGNRRQNNEDAWWVGQLGESRPFIGPDDPPLLAQLALAPALMLVSDGVGGANAGEVASQMTAARISGEMSRQAAGLRDSNALLPIVRSVLEETNNLVTAKAAEPGFEGMGATLSLLCFADDGKACWAQVGDSRIYLLRHGKLRQISHDHSPIGRMRQSGKLTEAEARSHPLRNQIDQSLGDPNAQFAPDSGIEPFQTADVFLVCSDGLSDGLWDHELQEILSHLHQESDVRPTVQELISRAKLASGRDNITATIAFVETGPSTAAGWRRWLRL
jgi:protein phosphatase